MQRFFFVTVFGFIIMTATYGLAFTGYIESSETALVRYSYLWVPVIAFGLGGMYAEKRKFKDTSKAAILTGIASFFLLIGFYEAIWPML